MSFDYSRFANDARQHTIETLNLILEPDGQSQRNPGGSHSGWICPNCSSGSGSKGTGLTVKNGELITCWSCDLQGDILRIIGAKYNITDNMEIAKKAAELMGLRLEDYGQGNYTTQYNTQQNKKTTPAPELPQMSYKDFILEAAKHIEDTDYHRGLSLETLKKYNIGYVKDWQQPNSNKKAPTNPMLIIPTSDYSYIARRTDTDEQSWKVRKVGAAHPFNSAALYNTESPVIFITEGELDALSIIEVGGEAVGTGGTSGTPKLLKILKENGKPAAPLIIAMDNDDAGKAAAERLKAGLEDLGYKQGEDFYCDGVNIYNTSKDANQALNDDRANFKMLVDAMQSVPTAEAAWKRDKYIAETSTREAADNFINNVKSRHTEAIKSGYKNLDKILDGGLYPGLYFIGALSSLGKTTFTLQMADQIAEQGRDVLIFSLEMSKEELIAKTLSRYTYLIERKKGKRNLDNAKTTRGLLDGSRYNSYNTETLNLIEQAIDQYKKTVAEHLYIIEGQGNIGTEEIKKATEQHIALTGNTPVIIIDYLQMLSPADVRASDKQNTDKAVLELKRLSRDTDSIVIAISSFNRNSYSDDASMTSFKESGAIEYGSDILIALQPKGLKVGDDKTTAKTNKTVVKKCKADIERKIELIILKNRNGSTDKKANYLYNTLFNYFEDMGEDSVAEDSGLTYAKF